MLYKTKARALTEAVVVNPAFPPPVQPGTPTEMAALAAIPAANAPQNETEVKRLAYTALLRILSTPASNRVCFKSGTLQFELLLHEL